MNAEPSAIFGSVITAHFDEPVLYNPIRLIHNNPCTSLKVITAFTDVERIQTHAIKIAEGIKSEIFKRGIDIEIILGMTKSSLSSKKHEDICRALRLLNTHHRGKISLSCRYIGFNQEVHSKIYVWEREGFPCVAFCGSLNYTMNAFYKRRESVCVANPHEALEYYRTLRCDTLDCYDASISDILKNIQNQREYDEEDPLDSASEYCVYDKLVPLDTLTVSLLQADGSGTGYGSGVNWGIRSNGTRRDPNQAYIPYNRKDRKAGFFPDREHENDKNCPMFKVITRDFGSFHMRMAQQGNKALHSVESNAILGEWIRTKIGAPQGGYITKQMLELYGKTYVTFRKYSDGVYLLDL